MNCGKTPSRSFKLTQFCLCNYSALVGLSTLTPIRNSSDEQISAAMAEVAALTLANICLDVQIGICMCLHPSDILALRHVRRHQKLSLHKPYLNYFLTRLVKLFNLAHGNG